MVFQLSITVWNREIATTFVAIAIYHTVLGSRPTGRRAACRPKNHLPVDLEIVYVLLHIIVDDDDGHLYSPVLNDSFLLFVVVFYIFCLYP